jgi:hypothetical protein
MDTEQAVTAADPQRWRGRIRASVSADADRVFEVVGLLDDLGFSTHLTHAHGRWQVELHRPKAPTVALLHRVVALFERAFPGRDAVTIVIDVGGRSYRLGRRAAVQRKGRSADESIPETGV